MSKIFLVILCLIFMVSADGCRSRREAQRVTRSDLSLEAVLEARHLDSVSLSDNFFEQVIFEFFPPDSARHTIQTGEGEVVPLVALRRVTVATGQSSTVTHVVADTVSARTERIESDFKSVETSRETNNTLPLAIGIAALLLAACAFILYNRRK